MAPETSQRIPNRSWVHKKGVSSLVHGGQGVVQGGHGVVVEVVSITGGHGGQGVLHGGQAVVVVS